MSGKEFYVAKRSLKQIKNYKTYPWSEGRGRQDTGSSKKNASKVSASERPKPQHFEDIRPLLISLSNADEEK